MGDNRSKTTGRSRIILTITGVVIVLLTAVLILTHGAGTRNAAPAAAPAETAAPAEAGEGI